MALIRYERSPISALFDELESLLTSGFELPGREIGGQMYPRVDILETDSGYTIRSDLPGVSKDDIKVSVENGVLTIRGEKKREVEHKEKNRYYHFERSFGEFSRSFTLPSNVDSQHVEAHFDNGILEINLRRSEEAKPKAIDVKVD